MIPSNKEMIRDLREWSDAAYPSGSELWRTTHLGYRAAAEIERLAHESKWGAHWHRLIESIATVLEVNSAGGYAELAFDIPQAIQKLRDRLAGSSAHETTDNECRAVLDDIYRSLCIAWDNRTLPASVLTADQFTKMREALEIPFPGYAKPGSPPVEITALQCAFPDGCHYQPNCSAKCQGPL